MIIAQEAALVSEEAVLKLVPDPRCSSVGRAVDCSGYPLGINMSLVRFRSARSLLFQDTAFVKICVGGPALPAAQSLA